MTRRVPEPWQSEALHRAAEEHDERMAQRLKETLAGEQGSSPMQEVFERLGLPATSARGPRGGHLTIACDPAVPPESAAEEVERH